MCFRYRFIPYDDKHVYIQTHDNHYITEWLGYATGENDINQAIRFKIQLYNPYIHIDIKNLGIISINHLNSGSYQGGIILSHGFLFTLPDTPFCVRLYPKPYVWYVSPCRDTNAQPFAYWIFCIDEHNNIQRSWKSEQGTHIVRLRKEVPTYQHS